MNGGIASTEAALEHLGWADGIMIGRAAYQRPALLAELQEAVFDSPLAPETRDVLEAYRHYMVGELAEGTRLHAMDTPRVVRVRKPSGRAPISSAFERSCPSQGE